MVTAWQLADDCLKTARQLLSINHQSTLRATQLNGRLAIQIESVKASRTVVPSLNIAKSYSLNRKQSFCLRLKIFHRNFCLLMPWWRHYQFRQIKLVNHWIIGQFLHILCCQNNNGDSLRTAWGLPEDCLRTAWGLPEYCLRTAWVLPEDCLKTA
jgi:hypothetical protein